VGGDQRGDGGVDLRQAGAGERVALQRRPQLLQPAAEGLGVALALPQELTGGRVGGRLLLALAGRHRRADRGLGEGDPLQVLGEAQAERGDLLAGGPCWAAPSTSLSRWVLASRSSCAATRS
jgi:hypothetical protein